MGGPAGGPPWAPAISVALLALLALLVLLGGPDAAAAERLLVGYITGSDRRPFDHRYPRPGLAISGAIALARDEVLRLHATFVQFNSNNIHES